LLTGSISFFNFSIREQIHKVRASGDFDPTFAIEKPFRSEEEARAWSPHVDFGENPDDDDDGNGGDDQDRKQRYKETYLSEDYCDVSSVLKLAEPRELQNLDIWHLMNRQLPLDR
jgi:hypothetical protein